MSLFSPSGGRQTYRVGHGYRMTARQGNMTVQAAAYPDIEKGEQNATGDEARLYGEAAGQFAFRPSACVGWLRPAGDDIESDTNIKLAVRLTLSTLMNSPSRRPCAGAPSLVEIAGADAADQPRLYAAFLAALDYTRRPCGFPAAPVDLDAGSLASTNITLIRKGAYTAPNTSGEYLSVGQRVKFVHPKPDGWRLPAGDKRPPVITSDDAPGTINYQMMLLDNDYGTAAWVESQLGGDAAAGFGAETGDLLSRGIAGLVARAILRLKAAGIIEITAAAAGDVDSASGFWATTHLVGNLGGPAGAVGGDAGRLIEGLVGESDALRNALVQAMCQPTTLREGDLGAGDADRVRKPIADAFLDAASGLAACTNAPGLYATVTSNAAPLDGVDIDIGGDCM